MDKIFTGFNFLIILALLILASVLHLMYGHCQTSKYHFICQAYWFPQYLPKELLRDKGLLLSEDKRGYTGTWIEWSEDDIKKYEGGYIDGMKNGKQIEWQEVEYRLEYFCTNNKLNGTNKTYNYLKGDPNQFMTLYQESYDKNKSELLLYDKKYLNDNLLESTFIVDLIKIHEKYENNFVVYEERIDLVTKHKIMEFNFRNKLKHGNCTNWYNNGELENIEIWVDGILVSKKFYEKNGKISGYTRDGRIEKVESFVDGMLDGECVYYHANNKIRLTADYQKGHLNGFVKRYDEKGALESSEKWVNNKLITD